MLLHLLGCPAHKRGVESSADRKLHRFAAQRFDLFAQRLFFLFGAGNHQLTRAVIIDRIDLRKLSAQLLHLLL